MSGEQVYIRVSGLRGIVRHPITKQAYLDMSWFKFLTKTCKLTLTSGVAIATISYSSRTNTGWILRDLNDTIRRFVSKYKRRRYYHSVRLMLNQDSRTSNNGRSSPHRHILLDQPGSDDSNSQQPGCSSSFGRPPPVSPGRSSPRSQALEGPTSRNKHADRMISQKKHSFLGKIRPGGYASLSSASGSGANERASERRLENPPQNKNEGQMMGNGSSASLCVGPVRRDKPGPLCSKRFYNAHPTPSPVRSAPVLDSQKENRPTSKRTVSTRDVSSPVGDESILENSQPAKRPRMQMLPDKQKEYPNQDNYQQGNLEEAGKHPDFYKYSHWFQKVKIGNPQTSKEKTNDGNSKGMLTLKMGKKKENLFRHGESEPEIIELSLQTSSAREEIEKLKGTGDWQKIFVLAPVSCALVEKIVFFKRV